MKPFELREQFATAVGLIAGSCSGFGLDRVDHELAQVAVGAEVVQPLDELVLKRLGLHDRLVAAVAATPSAFQRPGSASTKPYPANAKNPNSGLTSTSAAISAASPA